MDFKIGPMKVTKDGAPFLTLGAVTWHDISPPMLADLNASAAHAAKVMERTANKGGPLAVTSELLVTGGMRETLSYAGITYHGLCDIEQALVDVGSDLVKGGREHAKLKK
jgi:hypothetical protein